MKYVLINALQLCQRFEPFFLATLMAGPKDNELSRTLVQSEVKLASFPLNEMNGPQMRTLNDSGDLFWAAPT